MSGFRQVTTAAAAVLALFACWIAAGSARAAAPVTIETLDGKQLVGEVTELSATSLTLQTKAGSEKLPTASILSARPATRSFSLRMTTV